MFVKQFGCQYTSKYVNERGSCHKVHEIQVVGPLTPKAFGDNTNDIRADYCDGKTRDVNFYRTSSKRVRVCLLKGRFPTDTNQVAPGRPMSCLYNVRFLPDALCDYDDQLVVETLTSPLIVGPTCTGKTTTTCGIFTFHTS